MVKISKKNLEIIESSLTYGIELASKGVNTYIERWPNSPIVIRYKDMLNALEIVKGLKEKAKVESCQRLLNETDGVDP